MSGSGNGTLVCILGSVRGGPQAWQSLIDLVLVPLDAGLALIGKQTHSEQAMLYRRATFVCDGSARAFRLGRGSRRIRTSIFQLARVRRSQR